MTAVTKNARACGPTEHGKANFLVRLLTLWTGAKKKIHSLSEGGLCVPDEVRRWNELGREETLVTHAENLLPIGVPIPV